MFKRLFNILGVLSRSLVHTHNNKRRKFIKQTPLITLTQFYNSPLSSKPLYIEQDNFGQFDNNNRNNTDTTDPDQTLYITPEQFGANNSIDDDSHAFNLMFEYAADQQVSKVIISGKYVINSTVTIKDPNGLWIDATGAKFISSHPILMFDFNGRADPFYNDNESRQNFWWIGGDFIQADAPSINAIAIRMFGFRNAGLFNAHFKGFGTAIQISGKDTIKLRDLKFFDNLQDIANPPWSPVGGLLLLTIDGCHFSHQSPKPAISFQEAVTDLIISNCSFNLGTGGSATCIAIDRYMTLLPVDIIGQFQIEEPIIGVSSNAQMILAKTYGHSNGFNLTQPTLRLLGSDLKGEFLPGEKIIGTTSGTQAVIVSRNYGQYAALHTNNNPVIQNINIGPGMHFEAGSGANSAVGLKIKDHHGKGSPPMYLNIDMGSCGLNGENSVGIDLDASYARISGRFAQTKKSVPIWLQSKAFNVHIASNTFFSTGNILISEPDQRNIQFENKSRRYDHQSVLLLDFNNKRVYNQDTISSNILTTAPNIISSDIRSCYGGVFPRSALLQITMRTTRSTPDPQNVTIECSEDTSFSGDTTLFLTSLIPPNSPLISTSYEVPIGLSGQFSLRFNINTPLNLVVKILNLTW